MDTMKAFIMGEANRDKEQMVFDWIAAAWLIAEVQPEVASAGLRGDWEYTGGVIYRNGTPTSERNHHYLASTWAVPELNYDGNIIPCYRMKSEVPGWGSKTFWPEEALAILAHAQACRKAGLDIRTPPEVLLDYLQENP